MKDKVLYGDMSRSGTYLRGLVTLFAMVDRNGTPPQSPADCGFYEKQ